MDKQQTLHKFIADNFVAGAVHVTDNNDNSVTIIDRSGVTLTLTFNDNGDIIDAATNQIYRSKGV